MSLNLKKDILEAAEKGRLLKTSNFQMDITLTKEDIKPDSYLVSIRRFKNLVNKLPDDGEIRIEVEKDYGDRTRRSLEKIDGFKLQGKVLVICCTTNV